MAVQKSIKRIEIQKNLKKGGRTMKYLKSISLCITIFVSVFLVAPAGFAQGPIKIGAILPLADITGDHGAKAMKLAVKEINGAGGLLGRQMNSLWWMMR
jgi:ABC-type branched-subunit amino acid transport system substrate-binding protein